MDTENPRGRVGIKLKSHGIAKNERQLHLYQRSMSFCSFEFRKRNQKSNRHSFVNVTLEINNGMVKRGSI